MFFRRWFQSHRQPELEFDTGDEEMIRALRAQALAMSPADAGLAQSAVHPMVWAMVMETAYPEAVATLVAIGDGTTSLYLSTGGGVIGAGAYVPVRLAAEAFVAAAEEHLDAFEPALDVPPPSLGRVRFYARTFDGTVTAEAGERELADAEHPLAPLYAAGQSLLSAVRKAATGRMA